jgi:hypothetical protein
MGIKEKLPPVNSCSKGTRIASYFLNWFMAFVLVKDKV